MLKAAALWLCLGWVSQALEAPAQEKPTIAEVRIEGNLRVEDDGIRIHIKARPGTPFDAAVVEQDVKAIYRMGFFDDVKAELSPSGVLTYTVREKPYVREVRIQGNNKVGRDKIETALGIQPRTVLDKDKVLEGVERVRKLYAEQGYVNARVEHAISELENNQASILLDIEEGNRVLVERISFEGNRAFSAKELKGLMSTKEKWFLSFLTNRGVLDHDVLTNDIAVLSAHYYDHGYIRHKIDEPLILRGSEGIEIVIRIEEGEQYRVGRVEIGGDLIEEPQKLLSEIKLTSGQIFRGSRLRDDLAHLTEKYANRGFAFAKVEPVTRTNDDEKKVDIALVVERGPPVYFNRVTVSGNNKTRDKVVRRELKVAEQELFSSAKIKQSRNALQRTGYFEDVQLTTKRGERPDTVDLSVDVKEAPTGTFSVGAGYSSGDAFIFTSSISERNLFGRGQNLSAFFDIGSTRQDFILSFTEPYFRDRPLSVGLDAFNREREFVEFTSRSTGFGARTSYPLKLLRLPFLGLRGTDPADETLIAGGEPPVSWLEYVRGGVGYELTRERIGKISSTASQAIQDEKGTSLTSSLTPNLLYDSRDHFFTPTEGTLANVSLKLAGLGGDSRFVKLDTSARWHYPLYRPSREGGAYTLALGGTLGYGIGLKERSNGQTNLPLFERYFPGGINSVRGFKERSLGPREGSDAIGGDKQAILNVELLFPILEQMGLQGVAFFDMGQAFRDSEGFSLGAFRRSVGIGGRWLSPFGPLRVELGFPLNKKPGDETSVVGFSLGAQ